MLSCLSRFSLLLTIVSVGVSQCMSIVGTHHYLVLRIEADALVCLQFAPYLVNSLNCFLFRSHLCTVVHIQYRAFVSVSTAL